MGHGEGINGEPLSSEELLRRAREATARQPVEAGPPEEKPGEPLEEDLPPPPPVDRSPSGFADCPGCGKSVRDTLTSCVYCGTDLASARATPGSPTPPPPPAPAIRTAATTGYRSAVGLARPVQVLLGLWVVLASVAAAASFVEWRLLSRFLDDPLSVTIAQIEASDDRQFALGMAWIAAVVVTGIGFMAWTWRIYANVRTLGASPSQHARGWIIGGWFVPILNLWRPKQIIDDLWRSNDPEMFAGQGTGRMSQRVSPILHLWWGLWLIGGFVGQYLFRTRDVDDLEGLRTGAALDTASDVIFAVAAVAAFWLVAAMTRRQEAGAALVVSDYRPGEPIAGLRSRGATALLGGAALASVLVAFLVFDSVESSPLQEGVSSQDAPRGEGVLLDDVRVGDCADVPADVEAILALPTVPCDSPHDIEAFARVSHAAAPDDPYPSTAALDNEAFGLCLRRVESYVGVPALEAGLSVFTVVPSAESWRSGDRNILCLLQDPTLVKLPASVRDSGGIVPDGSKAIFALEVGDCYDDPETDAFWVRVAACDDPHDNEVYAVVEYPAGAAEPYPGDGAVTSFAATGCDEAFAGSVAPSDAARLDHGWITRPFDPAWDLGERAVRCGLWDRSLAKLRGSQLSGS